MYSVHLISVIALAMAILRCQWQQFSVVGLGGNVLLFGIGGHLCNKGRSDSTGRKAMCKMSHALDVSTVKRRDTSQQ